MVVTSSSKLLPSVLALERTVFVVDRQWALKSPTLLVVVAGMPELICSSSNVMDQDVSRFQVSGAILPADGVLRFSEDLVGAGVDVA